MIERYSVHRHPRWLSAIYPPAIGAATGPTNVHIEYKPTVTPRSTGLQKSDKAPPTTANGAQPKIPAKNLHIRMVYAFCAVATPIWNKAIPNVPTTSAGRRPYNSEVGPKITGPNENPKRKRLVPKVITSVLAWNSLAVALTDVLKIALVKVVTKVMPASMAVIVHLRMGVQFKGFSGSSGPSKTMILLPGSFSDASLNGFPGHPLSSSPV